MTRPGSGPGRRNPPPAAGSGPPGSPADVGAAEVTLRKLELTVRRRLDGLLQGNYLGLIPGPGSEPGYFERSGSQPGDRGSRTSYALHSAPW